MTYFDLTTDERDEWLKHPTTVAFFAAVSAQRTDATEAVLTALADEKDTHFKDALRMAGRIDGFDVIVKLAEWQPEAPTTKGAKK